MEVQCFAGATPWRPRVSARVGLLALVLVIVAVGAAAAQSVLGTIRGTVTDPGGGVIPKAAVLITDEATGAPHALETDGRGNFAVPNLQPGTYRVEVIVTNFKKFERAGVTVSTGAATLVTVQLEVGPVGETVVVTAEAPVNITLDSPAVTRNMDAQQIRDLPRNSRDVQDFLYLNPNVIGTSDNMQFLGGRTYGVSYIQDGQASTNAIFGTVGNSAPGLDAIQEMQVLSNSYSAEYGGLAGVVVTTKRGGQQYHGGAFYDFNSNALNSLTYGQTLTGVTRNDPNSETSQHRYGMSVGGPVAKRTFFFANYEGLRDKTIQGGARTAVPTAAMRNGDFTGTNIKVKDPLTGQPFSGNAIPPNRLDPSAQKIMNFFWPMPNQPGTMSGGYGIFQQYVPESRKRERFDFRVDHEAGDKHTIFARASYQLRDPRSFRFEAGNALTNLPIQTSNLTTYALIGGWTSILSNNIVNEVRVGYNYDHYAQKSNYLVAPTASQFGIEAAPTIGGDVAGFPTFTFQSSTYRPSSISDGGRNADRTQNQNSFSIADNLSWLKGAHSMRMGALYSRNMAVDGFGRGLSSHGNYRFNGTKTGNAFGDFLLGRPYRVDEQVSTRGDLNGHSTDFAAFFQDDWRVSQNLTLFLGLRYELSGTWNENSLLLANFQATGNGYIVVPNKEVWAKLPPGYSDPHGIWYSHVKLASEVGLGDTLVNADKNNFSPRVGFAYRLDPQGKTVIRGGFGLFHPTAAIQGIRDQLATNEFRYSIQRSPGPFQHVYSQGSVLYGGNEDIGTQGVWPDVQSPDIYQYNLTVERELPWALGARVSYLGSTMRKLLVNREYNSVRASTTPVNSYDSADNRLRPFPAFGAWMNMIENTGSGQFHALQFEVSRRFKRGFAIDASYTFAHSSSNAPDSGNSSLGVIQYDPYNLEADRGPDPFVAKHRLLINATVDVPVGKDRAVGSDMPIWADKLFGGWTVSTIFQARSGANLTPFFSLGYSSYTPYNIGFNPDTTGVWTGDTYKPNLVGDPKANVPNGLFFNPAAYALPGEGQFPGTTPRNSLEGPGNWVINLAFYKDIISRKNVKVQFTATIDNVFNTAQFFPDPGSDFLNLTDYLINDTPDNGTMGVLGAGAQNNVEGFAFGRVIRLGLRARF
ncbi:MAG TPA: carboxypeptidase regulatory-like domain-containing protein [Vicinamibacterales bacterium]